MPSSSALRRLLLLLAVAPVALPAPAAQAAARRASAGEPTVTLTATPPAQTTSTDATIAFTATNATSIRCRVDGGVRSACTSPLVLHGLAPGVHTVTVRVANATASAVARDWWTVVAVANGPAAGSGSATLTAPAAGAALAGIVPLTAAASVPSGRVLWVDFLVDGRIVGSDSTAPYGYQLDVARLPAGPHVLQVAVWDAALGRSLSAPVPVTTSAAPAYTASVSTASGLRDAVARVGAAGGGSVYLAPGSYTLSSTLVVPDNVLVLGAGPDATTLRAAAPSASSLVALTGSHSVLAHLSLDYGRGTFDAVEISRSGNVDDLVQDVHIDGLGPGAKGVEFWGADHHGLSVQDSVIEGDAVASQGIRDSIADTSSSDDSVFRTQVSDFLDFGLIFEPYDAGQPKPGPRELAVQNTVQGVQNPATNDGTNEAGIWLGGEDGVAYGNVVSDTGWEGIWTGGDALRVQVVGNTIRDTTVAGVYLEHQSDDALVARNDIAGTPYGVTVEWTYGGVGTDHVRVANNTIVGADYGVNLEVGTDDSSVLGNSILDSRLAAVRLLGVKRTVVRGNDLRSRAGAPVPPYAVSEQVATLDGGGTTPADYSVITSNDCRGTGRGVAQLDAAHSRVAANVWP